MGYGLNGEVTTISYGPDSGNKYPCYYFRHTFNVSVASQIGESRNRLDQLVLNLERELEKTRSKLHEAEIQESRLSGLVQLYQDKIDRIKQDSEMRQEQILAEADQILKDANVTAERVIREIKETKASRASI